MKTGPIKDVAQIIMGTAPPGSSYNTHGDGLPMIAGAGDYGHDYPNPKKWTTAASAITEPGDLIVCVRATIGDLNWADKKYCLGRGVAALRPKNGCVDKRFLAYFLQANKAALSRLGTGTTFLAIRRGDIENFEIPLPPLSEQKRIADILDKADAIRRKRQEAEGYIRGLISSNYDDLFGQPLSNPKEWPVENLADVVADGTTVSYGIVQCGDHVPEGVPYIRTSNMSDERLPPLEAFGRTHPDIAKKFRRSTVRTGDLVFANRATIGAVVAVPDYLDGANLTQGTTRISPGRSITTDYLLWTVRTPQLQAWFDRWAKGVTFREITMGQLRETPIPIPTMHVQKEFARRLQQIRKVEMHLHDGSTQAASLFNSLVQRAFRGDL